MPKPARKSASPTPTPSKPRTRSDVSAKAGKAKVADKAPALSKAKPKAAPRKQGAAAALTDLQKQFVTEYLKDQNATQAAIRAGYSPKTAQEQSSRLLSKVMVRAQVDEGLARIREKAERETAVTLERVIKEIAKGAFFDPRAMFNEDGSPKAVTELGDREASALAGFEVLEQFEGSGAERTFVGHLKKFKLSERKAYLDMLMKHLGGYEKDNEQKTSPLVELLGIVHGSGSLLPRKAQ